MTTTEVLSTDDKPSIGGILKNGAIAGGAAIVINAILYFLGSAMGWFPDTVITPMGTPLNLSAVIMVTLFGAIGGTVVYLLLSRFLSRRHTNITFWILAVLVLVFMAGSPLQMPGASTGQIVMLEIMHLVAGLLPIYYLPKSV